LYLSGSPLEGEPLKFLGNLRNQQTGSTYYFNRFLPFFVRTLSVPRLFNVEKGKSDRNFSKVYNFGKVLTPQK